MQARSHHQCKFCAGDPEHDDAPEPLHAALPNKEAFQHVRALPCAAGGAVIFTHRLIHWGSAASKRAAQPRIAMSFVSADPTFEVRLPSHVCVCQVHRVIGAQMSTVSFAWVIFISVWAPLVIA
jgi:ectoine hydroxylase-related dioxygenase (phytanoyl-CoA dioxygenase family)